MDSYFSRTFFLIAVLCALLTMAQAAEVHLTEGQLIVAGIDDSIGLGGFDVVLSYGSDVSVISVEPLSGFLIAKNIRNDRGMTIIAGISAEGLTGDIPVASVEVEGTGPVTISVRDLGNTRGDPIAFTNPEFSGTIPTPGSSVSKDTPGSGSGTLAPTQTFPLVTTTIPAETPQVTEAVIKPTALANATVIATEQITQVSPTIESEETSGGLKETESTPKATLSIVIALSAVFIVLALKRKG